MKANSLTIREKAKAHSSGPMEENTSASGKGASSMAWESTLARKGPLNGESGRTDARSDGLERTMTKNDYSLNLLTLIIQSQVYSPGINA
jgi:hypothetical protein